MDYIPMPYDTTDVELPAEILELTELLAYNTHEVWARQRLADGWKWGPHRNDERKEHPSLIPYEALSEQEKEYDRATALETIKVILVLGYSVTKIDPETELDE